MSDRSDHSHASRRVEATFRVRYETVDQLADAVVEHLSRRQLFLPTPRQLAVGATVRIHLELPDDGGQLSAICRVRAVRDAAAAAASGVPPGLDVELVDFDDERLARIERFVTKRRATRVSGRPRAPLRVVVADDDAVLRGAIAAALERRGDEVRQAGDGIDALSACLNDPPDLLLSDVQMPRMDGWQLLRILRARTSLVQVPIVLLTTLTDDAARLEGYRLGVDDYIGKPVADGELLDRVDRVVERAQKAGDRRGLRGDLEHVALPSLLSFLAVERKTGILSLAGDAKVRMLLRGGQPLRIEIDEAPIASTDDARLRAVLTWKQGQFEFGLQDVACTDELHTTVNALLLANAEE